MKHVLLTLLLCFLAVPAFAEDGFVSLMTVKSGDTWTENDKPLSGWVKYGGEATYKVDGNEIVGTRGTGDNTFLCTEKKYSNFIFTCEFKFDIDCNSGVQFRSDVRRTKSGDKETTRVFGYQYEMTTGSPTGCVYDEGRRGRWIEPLSEEQIAKSKEAVKADQWNEIKIQCVGPSVKTWINGVKITDLYDIESSEGFFGLQIHSGPQGQVRWRNAKIKELPATPWISLYSNKTFGDVEIKPVGKWEIQEDGSVSGTTETGQAKDGMVLSKKSYKDFAVKVSFQKIAGNSGLYFRATEVDKPYWLKGFQNEIEAGGVCGGLWEVEGRGWVKRNDEVAEKVYKAKDWNDIATVAIGDHLITYLNGQKIVDIIDPECAKEGKTGLQLHGGGDQGYLFREYWIMPLNEEAVKLISQE